MKGVEKNIIFSVAILIVFFVVMLQYSSSIRPVECRLEDIAKYDGRYVKFVGVVVRILEYSGGYGLELKSTNKTYKERIIVFADDLKSFPRPGSLVEIEGVVSGGGKIVNAYIIKILSREYLTTLEEILKNPEYFLGLYVSLRGNITNLRIIENRSRLIITDGIHEVTVHLLQEYIGETINLHFYGIFDGRKIVCYPEPYGVYLDNSSIPIAPVSLENLREYIGKEVHVIGSIISYERRGYSFYLVNENFRIRCFSDEIPSGDVIFGKLLYNYYEGYYYIKVGE